MQSVIHTYIHTYIHTFIHTYIHTYIHTAALVLDLLIPCSEIEETSSLTVSFYGEATLSKVQGLKIFIQGNS